VICKSLSDGAVLFSTADEVYFGLNAAGVRVWQLLPPTSATLDDLCRALCSDYPEASPERVRDDIVQLIDDLVANGLAEPALNGAFAERGNAVGSELTIRRSTGASPS
jgi:hypothetical protein